MAVKDRQIVLTAIFLLLGMAIAVQIKSNLKLNTQKPAAVYRIEELQKQVEDEKKYGEKLKALIEEGEKKKEQYLQAAVDEKNSKALNEMLEKLNEAKLKAGLTDVKGPGLVVKLDDAAVRMNENPNVLIIHDSDIIRVLNELKKAGAQAISVNGERVIATSEQVCAGPTIRINKNRYTAPFIIHAIGNPDLMYDSLSKSETIALMIRDKIKVEIEKSNAITIPKYGNNASRLTTGVEVAEK